MSRQAACVCGTETGVWFTNALHTLYVRRPTGAAPLRAAANGWVCVLEFAVGCFGFLGRAAYLQSDGGRDLLNKKEVSPTNTVDVTNAHSSPLRAATDGDAVAGRGRW